MSASSAAPTLPEVPSAQPLQTARRMQGSGEGGTQGKPVLRTVRRTQHLLSTMAAFTADVMTSLATRLDSNCMSAGARRMRKNY